MTQNSEGSKVSSEIRNQQRQDRKKKEGLQGELRRGSLSIPEESGVRNQEGCGRRGESN